MGINTAKGAVNAMRKGEPLTTEALTNVLQQIETAANAKLKTIRISKGTPKLKTEIEAKGFKVKDTGMVWHISW